MFYLSRNEKALYKYCELFQKYLNEHHNCPEYWEDTSGSYSKSISNAPVELSYVVNLMKHGIKHNEAWSMSMGYLSWLNATIQELSGIDRTFTDPLEEPDDPIDMSKLTEDQIYKIAEADLGKERALELMKKRRENGL